MQAFPHHYHIRADAEAGNLRLSAEGLPALAVAAPPEFDGPGDQWSPESLLMASVTSCFILSFRAIATASRLEWLSLDCESEGVLDKVERQMRFTSISLRATLTVPAAVDCERAEKLLHKAEQSCLVSNSLATPVHLQCKVRAA